MKNNRFWLTIFLILQALDIATTFVGLRAGLYEANAIARALGAHLGEWAMYGWKATAMSIFFGLLLILHRRYPYIWVAVRLSAIVLLLAVSFNLLNLALESSSLMS